MEPGDRLSRLQAMVDACPLAMVELDGHGLVRFWSPGAVKMFGWTPEEVTGFPPPGLTQIPASLLESGSEIDLPWLGEGGAILYVHLWIKPLADDRGAILIFADITGRKQAEQQIQSMRSELFAANRQIEHAKRFKGEFAASMSHDLRTPLHTIIGFSELLAEELEGPLNEKQRRFVGHIRKDSLRLLELINSFLDLSNAAAIQSKTAD